MRYIVSLLVVVLIMSSCQQDEIRMDLLQINQKNVEFELGAQEEIQFFADIDIEFRKKPDLVYHCDFYFEGKPLYSGGVDPLNTTDNLDDTLLVNDGITHWKFYGKLEGSLIGHQLGVYTIKTQLIKNNDPNLKINKADIVFVK